jgi:inner membrane protein involved in colicin E2 resistance
VWTLLKAEDLSLLMGSVGLFAILAGVMWLTRKVQWQKRDPVADDEGIDPVYGTRA